MSLMIDFCRNIFDCRRTQIMRYFDEVFEPQLCNGLCDVCRDMSGTHEQDFRAIAVKAIELAESMCSSSLSGSITRTQFKDAFKGAKGQKLGAKHSQQFDELDLYGAGQNCHDVDHLLDELLARGLFRVVGDNNYSHYKMEVSVMFISTFMISLTPSIRLLQRRMSLSKAGKVL